MPPIRHSKRTQTRPNYIPAPASRNPKPKPSYLHLPPSPPNTHLSLFTLPPELFHTITSHLPRSAEISLTLTCKLALHLIGRSSWGRFRAKRGVFDETYGPLCAYLLRDLPDYTYCDGCEMLHPPVKRPGLHRTSKFTKICFGQMGTVDFWVQTEQGGYSLVFSHIQEAFNSKPANHSQGTSAPIDLFEGDFTTPFGDLSYRLISSARWINHSLILRQEHRLQSQHETDSLTAGHITSLPFCICAHLSTTRDPPPEAQRATIAKNGPLLTHAIVSAFPEGLRGGSTDLDSKTFRAPAPTEQLQMDDGGGDSGYTWRCRGCPTKFTIQYNARPDSGTGTGNSTGNGNRNRNKRGELVVTAWHNFGKELYKARDYWGMFVRREGATLGAKKRNSEFFVGSRGWGDFETGG
ncbi:hypothetical protein BJX70DRAFT_369485 [Aspergillus crustosus]